MNMIPTIPSIVITASATSTPIPPDAPADRPEDGEEVVVGCVVEEMDEEEVVDEAAR
jgi:hypothetical protein